METIHVTQPTKHIPLHQRPGFIALPSDPSQLTAEHARLIFTNQAANRTFLRELARLVVEQEAEREHAV